MTTHPQTKCGLFKLPPEIRNEIYTLVLTVSRKRPAASPKRRPIRKGAALLKTHPDHPNRPTVLSILRSCRQIHDEAYGIFYSTQTLRLDITYGRSCYHTNCMAQMARLLSKRRLESFRKLQITASTIEECTSAFKGLKHFMDLEVVKIYYCAREYSPHIIDELKREGPLMKIACLKLPLGLKHLDVRMVPRYKHSFRLSDDERRTFREALMLYLCRYKRDGEHSPETERSSPCSCLWCDPSLKTRVRLQKSGKGTL